MFPNIKPKKYTEQPLPCSHTHAHTNMHTHAHTRIKFREWISHTYMCMQTYSGEAGGS